MINLRSISALIALTLSSSAFAFENVSPVDAYELAKSDPNTMILDVRSRYEWGFVGHPSYNPKTAEGAELDGKVVNISYQVVTGEEMTTNTYFIEDVKKILAEKPNMKFITMCRSGSRSVAAATALEAAGIAVSNMSGGFEGGKDANGYRTKNGWKNAGLPYTAACDGNGYARYKFEIKSNGNMIQAQAFWTKK